jgi:hypothetical protein
MDLRKMASEGEDWIQPAQDGDAWKILVIAVMKHQVP